MHRQQLNGRPPHRATPPEFHTVMTPDEWALVDRLGSDPERMILLARLWSRVDRSGGPEACWPCLSGADSRPSFSWKGVSYVAARVAYELTHGPLAPDQFACHTCDNGLCLNPRHLFAGTIEENHVDMWLKGRMPRGEDHKRHRLTADDVRAIRAEVQAGASTRGLARRFGVADHTVRSVLTGRTWRHVH